MLAEVRSHLTSFEDALAAIDELRERIEPTATRVKVIDSSLSALRGQLEGAFAELTSEVAHLTERQDAARDLTIRQLDQVTDLVRTDVTSVRTDLAALRTDLGEADATRAAKAAEHTLRLERELAALNERLDALGELTRTQEQRSAAALDQVAGRTEAALEQVAGRSAAGLDQVAGLVRSGLGSLRSDLGEAEAGRAAKAAEDTLRLETGLSALDERLDALGELTRAQEQRSAAAMDQVAGRSEAALEQVAGRSAAALDQVAGLVRSGLGSLRSDLGEAEAGRAAKAAEDTLRLETGLSALDERLDALGELTRAQEQRSAAAMDQVAGRSEAALEQVAGRSAAALDEVAGLVRSGLGSLRSDLGEAEAGRAAKAAEDTLRLETGLSALDERLDALGELTRAQEQRSAAAMDQVAGRSEAALEQVAGRSAAALDQVAGLVRSGLGSLRSDLGEAEAGRAAKAAEDAQRLETGLAALHERLDALGELTRAQEQRSAAALDQVAGLVRSELGSLRSDLGEAEVGRAAKAAEDAQRLETGLAALDERLDTVNDIAHAQQARTAAALGQVADLVRTDVTSLRTDLATLRSEIVDADTARADKVAEDTARVEREVATLGDRLEALGEATRTQDRLATTRFDQLGGLVREELTGLRGDLGEILERSLHGQAERTSTEIERLADGLRQELSRLAAELVDVQGDRADGTPDTDVELQQQIATVNVRLEAVLDATRAQELAIADLRAALG